MRQRWKAALAALGVVLLLLEGLGTPATASAQDARQLFIAGEEAYRLGDYDAATSLWERAYEQDPRPGLLYNLGQAHERAGRLVEAIDAFERFLASPTEDPTGRADVGARLTQLRARLARTAIIVRTDVEGAVVLVDGEDRARTPRRDPLTVAPGERHVVVRYAGHRDFELRVHVPAGGQITIEPQFEASEAEAGGAEASGAIGPAAGEGTGPSLSVAPWFLIGGGAAVAIVGGVFGGLASSEADAARYRDDAHADAARSYALVSDVMLPVGAAVAVGGLAWLVIELVTGAPASPESASLRLAPQLGPSMVGLSTETRF